MIYKDTSELTEYWNQLHKLVIRMGASSQCRNDIFAIYIEDILKQASVAYYTTGETIMTDAVYDSLEDSLKVIKPQSPLLNKVGTK